jgi:hypothetical protein
MVKYKPVKLFPGHGPHISNGLDLITRYLRHRQARENQVVVLMENVIAAGGHKFGLDWSKPTTVQIARFL